MMANKGTNSINERFTATEKNVNKEAEAKLREFVETYSDDVFRSFLSEMSSPETRVVPFSGTSRIADSVAYFPVSKFVVNESEKATDCLKTVYHVLANSNCCVALLIHRKQNECEFGLAVGNPSGSSERTIKNTERLKDAFRGTFPGSSCCEIHTDSSEDLSLFKQINKNYSSRHNSSLAVVSNVATELSENYVTQGIEKLLDGIRPDSSENEYTIVLLGEALDNKDLKIEKQRLYDSFTMLSPFASVQQNFSIDEAKNKNWSFGVLFANYSPSPQTKGTTYDVTHYEIKHTLDVIEKQMERLEECAALGLWKYAAYVTSPDLAITNEVANMLLSLTQGNESYTEQPAVNVWNGQNQIESQQIEEIMNYISFLQHPKFELKGKTVTPTTIVSGIELARALSFPQKSVPGFPVYKCARFGRNITKFRDDEQEQIRIGNIYHMRQTENTAVCLDKNSLASHVFITGSTGAGKSNTVFQILKRADTTYLVVEPAKGEYKDILGNEKGVRILGTNPKLTELLRIDPFAFPENISVTEHIDRLVELFNVCWPMYAAMPAILKEAVIRSYEAAGWDLELSENQYDASLFPTFSDVLSQIRIVLNESEYSSDNKSDYTGALVTRLKSLTNGINGQLFSSNSISDSELFDSRVVVDLSRVGSTETKAMIMGLLIMKLQEYRISSGRPDNKGLKHITVLEEAHNVLKRTSTEQTSESANLLGKSVEMLTNSIAELRAFGEGFIIADQAPGLLDMAVIRNTNTKIIHRLPDLSDRELAGKAAGLNEEQIEELAKLELGVAAVYQNDWIEPVLCKVDEYIKLEYEPYCISNNLNELVDNRKAVEMVRDVLLNPNEYIKVDASLIMRSQLPAQIKIMINKMFNGVDVPLDERALYFHMLYPDIVLDSKKIENSDYVKEIYADILKECGELSEKEVRIASAYLITVFKSGSRIDASSYNELMKEIVGHD